MKRPTLTRLIRGTGQWTMVTPKSARWQMHNPDQCHGHNVHSTRKTAYMFKLAPAVGPLLKAYNQTFKLAWASFHCKPVRIPLERCEARIPHPKPFQTVEPQFTKHFKNEPSQPGARVGVIAGYTYVQLAPQLPGCPSRGDGQRLKLQWRL